ncbi:hypothetical protein Tco_0699889 [Tanacetum coccineum]
MHKLILTPTKMIIDIEVKSSWGPTGDANAQPTLGYSAARQRSFDFIFSCEINTFYPAYFSQFRVSLILKRRPSSNQPSSLTK